MPQVRSTICIHNKENVWVSLPWRSHWALTHHPVFQSTPYQANVDFVTSLLTNVSYSKTLQWTIKYWNKISCSGKQALKSLSVFRWVCTSWWSNCFFCVLSSLTFTGWFGFILVIPSEVQENVTEAPEKPGKYKHTITSLWPTSMVLSLKNCMKNGCIHRTVSVGWKASLRMSFCSEYTGVVLESGGRDEQVHDPLYAHLLSTQSSSWLDTWDVIDSAMTFEWLIEILND